MAPGTSSWITLGGRVSNATANIRGAVDAPENLKQMGLRARRLAEQRFDRIKVTSMFGTMLAGVAA